MGVPKFFRWISERYPNISRVINDNQIPDFDNFYLDMNGIIHQCSHINEDNCETNVTEEEIFRNIFHYLDFLFRLIKPKKVFFMAIDGVAPRAKMNQQRARRFRAGQDRMRKLRKIAEKSGQSVDELAAKHFDTNSITPGTQFMANLHEQLKYFIHVKLNTDPLWEGVDVHLSGHLTPGEGEHKIMEYIRYTRSQPGYDVNTRHCLYGLDADLIMLGLVTHEIHFALLREEVKYGSKKAAKILAPEEITWHMFHTCLLRNYIDLEFRPMRESLKIPYDLECIIDDWILMAYLVGNDFIPHLPHVHIKEEALSILWEAYKKVLPTLDGYLNESGELNLTRFETYLTELAKYDYQRYADENDSFKNLRKLNGRKKPAEEKSNEEDIDGGFNFAALENLNLPAPPPALDPAVFAANEVVTPPAVASTKPKASDSSSTSEENELSSDSDSTDDDDDTDSGKKRSTLTTALSEQNDIDKMPLIEAEFRQHKNHYYREKMKINFTSCEELQVYVNQYIEALQWILKYYYQGCPSWSWFYPQHYAPYLSDLKNFKDVPIKLQKGAPFKPFEQLLSVLPPTSRSLLPAVLQPLMVDPSSPLLHFYPENFQLDQNEKKQDWEAIVLLPFIDEELLLKSITPCYTQLQPAEQARNRHSASLCYHATPHSQPVGAALQPNPHFPALQETRAVCQEMPADHYRPDGLFFKHNHFQEKDTILYPKFPALNLLPYRYGYKGSAVNVFGTRSKGATLVLNLSRQTDPDCIAYNPEWNAKDPATGPAFQITNIQTLVHRYLGKRVFVDWPHFQQGIVCAVSDFRHVYMWQNIPGGSNFYAEPIDPEANQDFRNVTQTPIYVSNHPFEVTTDHNKAAMSYGHPLGEAERQMEYSKALTINRSYENQRGISIGPIPILLYVSPLIGYRTKCSATSDKCRTTMCFSNQALAYPLQTTVFTLPNYKSDLEYMPRTIQEYFKTNERVFALRSPYYSASGYVQQVSHDRQGKYAVTCRMEPADMGNQPDTVQLANKLQQHQLHYSTAQQIADRLRTSPSVIAKITGKINVFGSGKGRRRPIPFNIGLSWKMNKPLKQLHGYTKKINDIWCYSEAAVGIITEYMAKFPEIIAELERRPKDDNYFEANIWPDRNPKKEVPQVRLWMKTLPTYSMSLTDAAWSMLDAPTIAELDKSISSFYAKRAEKKPTDKIKTAPFEPEYLFKASESLGMCEPDVGTVFYLFDRVVSVRLGTGVPIGTRGTIVGIMFNRNHLDTYYEILFDQLPANSLDAILYPKDQGRCRVKVHSYHLINYSHSLRLRSMGYQNQRSVPANNTRDQQPQQSNRTPQRNSQEKTPSTKPKSAPPLTANEKPKFPHGKNPPPSSSVSNENVVPPVPTTENPSLPPPTAHPVPHPEPAAPLPATMAVPPEPLPSSFPEQSLFQRAVQDSSQWPNPPQLSPLQPPYPQQIWGHAADPRLMPFLDNGSMDEPPPVPFAPFEQLPPPYNPPQFHPSSAFNPFEQLLGNPIMVGDFNGAPAFAPYNLPPVTPPGYPLSPSGLPLSIDPMPHQSPAQMQHAPPSSATSSRLSHESPVFEPRQTAPPVVANKDTLKFVPSQVLRNMPK